MVSEASGEKLLGVAKIPSGTGENSANAVYEMLDRWNLLDKVQGMSFDTTAANSVGPTCLGNTTICYSKIGS